MFSAKFTTVVFCKNDYDDKNFHHCFLILYYNKFLKVCGHTPKYYCSKKYYNKLHVVFRVTPALDSTDGIGL